MENRWALHHFTPVGVLLLSIFLAVESRAAASTSVSTSGIEAPSHPTLACEALFQHPLRQDSPIFAGWLEDDGVQVRLLRPMARGPRLNRIAYILKHFLQTDFALSENGGGLYREKPQRIVMGKDWSGKVDEGALHHEIAHRVFKNLAAKNQATLLSGKASETLEELYTYPLSMKFETPPERNVSSEMFRSFVLGRNLRDIQVSQNVLDVLQTTPQSLNVKLEAAEVTLYHPYPGFPNSVGPHITVRAVTFHGGQFVAVEVENIDGLTYRFSAENAASFVHQLKAELENSRSAEERFASPTLNLLLERLKNRSQELTELISVQTEILDRLDAALLAGRAGDQESSELFASVKTRQRKIEVPLTNQKVAHEFPKN